MNWLTSTFYAGIATSQHKDKVNDPSINITSQLNGSLKLRKDKECVSEQKGNNMVSDRIPTSKTFLRSAPYFQNINRPQYSGDSQSYCPMQTLINNSSEEPTGQQYYTTKEIHSKTVSVDPQPSKEFDKKSRAKKSEKNYASNNFTVEDDRESNKDFTTLNEAQQLELVQTMRRNYNYSASFCIKSQISCVF